jgi:hypothetical protein
MNEVDVIARQAMKIERLEQEREDYSLITAAAEVLKQDSLAVIAALRRKGWNSAIRRAAEVAEHYAGLMKSEAAQRVADEIRAMLSDGKS